MPSSYNNPSATPKDSVRFLIGDTGPTTFKFTDQEILFLLETEANIYMAAAVCSDKLTTMVSTGGLASKTVGRLSLSYSQGSVAFYQSQAKYYRMRGSGHQVPFAEEIIQRFSFSQFDASGTSEPRLRVE